VFWWIASVIFPWADTARTASNAMGAARTVRLEIMAPILAGNGSLAAPEQRDRQCEGHAAEKR
jgi:hypothetical protein